MAELWKLPVVYVIENNQYAMGTSVARSSAVSDFSKRGASFGIPGVTVDGMDVEAVQKAGADAFAHCRAGKGPIILEMKTYRYRGHSMSDPAKYRTKEELAEFREKRDPIENFGKKLIERGVVNEEDLKQMDAAVKAQVVEAASFATESPEPGLAELYTDIYA
jgi:pyruvate dehydrogenase E1 component alpha subunit